MWPIATDVDMCLFVCLSVGHICELNSCAKMAEPLIEMPFGGLDLHASK